MSHFTVLVVGKGHEGALAPFQENDGTCPEEYLEFMAEVPKRQVKRYIKERLSKMAVTDRPGYARLSDEAFMKKYAGFIRNEKGDFGYFANPNSKWDWYEMGGRWRGYFKPKPGRSGVVGKMSSFDKKDMRIWPEGVDQAYKGYIDFEAMFKERPNDIATFAVLMDGKWYEKGEMGWWGMVRNEKADEDWNNEFRMLIDSIPDDLLLTVVDCHI